MPHCEIVTVIFQLKNKDDFDNCTGFEQVKADGVPINPDGGSWTFKPTKVSSVIAAVESLYFNFALLCHYRKALTTLCLVLAKIVSKETIRLENLNFCTYIS